MDCYFSCLFYASLCVVITVGNVFCRLIAVDSGHFTHVLTDEFGQALEPAALVLIGGVLRKAVDAQLEGQVILVLAGDPMQLGPICNPIKAENFGLGVTLSVVD
jgi:hypothetical protein